MQTRRIAIAVGAFVGGVFAVNAWLAGARRSRPAVTLDAAWSRRVKPAPPSRAATRDELYETAKRLDIPGRSRMSKAELEQAVAERTAPLAVA